MNKRTSDIIIRKIIEDSRNGDYGLMEKIISNANEYILMLALPKDIKKEISKENIGGDIYVVEKEYAEEEIELLSFFDDIEAMSAYHTFAEKKRKSWSQSGY